MPALRRAIPLDVSMSRHEHDIDARCPERIPAPDSEVDKADDERRQHHCGRYRQPESRGKRTRAAEAENKRNHGPQEQGFDSGCVNLHAFLVRGVLETYTRQVASCTACWVTEKADDRLAGDDRGSSGEQQ
jgi:hypothetical protein